MKQRIIKVTDDDIRNVYENYTLHEAASKLDMTVVTLWRRAKKINLHWKDKPRKAHNKIPLDEILSGKHPYYQTLKLKKRLIKEKILEDKCNICNITKWNGKKLTMRLDHIDGDSHNHLLKNLRLICPNCDSQLPTYCGKN